MSLSCFVTYKGLQIMVEKLQISNLTFIMIHLCGKWREYNLEFKLPFVLISNMNPHLQQHLYPNHILSNCLNYLATYLIRTKIAII